MLGIRVEHMKQRLRDAMKEEEKGMEGLGKCWQVFVKLIQKIWDRGKIPQQISWMMVVLIPQVGGDYQDIGLLETFWKTIEILMDHRSQVIEFHDCLQGFLKGRGYGTATI